jgi:DNA-binding MarR family transcriptional regulator
MATQQKAVEAVTREIRACFARLRALGDALHHDLGITASQRAVLESLFEGGAQTVPQIARAKRVSRQHIQALVDSLVPTRLVTLSDNPKHKRSPLVTLTEHGRKTFAAARAREVAVVSELAAALANDDVAAALATLQHLRAALEERLIGGSNDD